MYTPPPFPGAQPGAPTRAQFAARHFTTRHGDPWTVRPYQLDSLESNALRKVHCDGRDVGKTTEIEIIVCWALAHCPGKEILIATQTENHLEPLMRRIHRRIQTIPLLKDHLVESRRSPSWYYRFDNGATLWGRIAGPRGTNFQGMHADWQIIDEAQELTETAWAELFPALNGGGARWVYGVPNGLRNTFHRLTQDPNAEHHHWPSPLNPDFTPEKDAELTLLYGGKNTPGYTQRVLGQHGSPAQAVFDLDDYLACTDPNLPFHQATLREGDELDLPDTIPPAPYYLGADLGFARDPSELVIYRDDTHTLTNVARFRLENINYARQKTLLQELHAAYHFTGIGIDCGNAGRALAHQLMELGEDWCQRLHAYEFGGTLLTPPLPDGTRPRRRTKEYMTELITRRMAERTLTFPRLPDRESQYASHTYDIGPLGRPLYNKGHDHLIDADRCALLRHHLATQDLPIDPTSGILLDGF